MDSSSLIVFLLLIFGTVFLLSQVILVPTFGTKSQESRLINKRLKQLHETGIHKESSLVRQKFLRELSPIERWFESIGGLSAIEELLEQSGKTYPAYRVVLVMFFLSIITAAIAWYLTANFIATAFVLVLFAWLPMIKLKRDRKKRMDMFEEQLPEALDMMTRALRAGYPFNDSLKYISEEMAEPISKEFGILFEEINYGRDVREAFNFLLMRVPSLSLVATTTAILIQRETGGNLAELLDKISQLLRQRFRFQRKVTTITAEGRISAWVLSLLPFAVFLFIAIQNPDFLKPLFIDQIGNYLLIGGLILQVIGAFWVRKLINFDI